MSPDERKERVTQILDRRVQAVFPERDAVIERLASSEKLTFYLGIDPTGILHLGHAIPLLLLRDLQELGHKVTVLMGDFTARIGDPTDKTAARKELTEDEIRTNMDPYLDRIGRILPRGSFTVAYNNDWLSGLTMEQVVKLASHVTVQQMIQRDMFQERLKNEKPIYLHEFLYPLMQGYDSVALRTDGEVGGNDQIFNMLMGRELERALIGKDKIVLAIQLLVNANSGKKMSKSEGELIALADTPQEIRRKVLALDDTLTATVFRLCTQKDTGWIESASKDDPRAFKEALAAELVRVFHGEDAVVLANTAEAISATGALDKVLKDSGLASSASEAKKLINQGAVRVNGETVKEWGYVVKLGDEVQVGKGRRMKVQ